MKGSTIMLTLTGIFTAGAIYAVHKAQTDDRERMHRLARRDIEEDRRKRECAENGGPCDAKPPARKILV